MTSSNGANDSLLTESKVGDVAVVCIDSPPVNALSLAVRQAIDSAVKAAISDDSVKAIILICQGKTFFAGADIKELGAPPISPRISDLNRLVEDSPKPVIAAIHGTALGGGLELAMSCHYRIAIPSAKCGLTEVSLGILPGAGGTQRLPRIVGIQKALEMITGADRLSAQQCLDIGLLDAMASEDALLDDAVAFAKRIADKGLPLLRVQDRDQHISEARDNPNIFSDFRKKNARKFRGLNAPERCIRCVESAVSLGFDEGLAFEKKMFAELNEVSQPAALQYAFFAERNVKKIPAIAAVKKTDTDIRAVGVVGAGTMGGGIAMNFANIGIPVTLLETSQEALDRGLATIRKNYERSLSRGRITQAQLDERMACLSGSVNYADLTDVDLVIEAVFEDMSVKKSVFAKLDTVVNSRAILATNTSFLDIQEIASATSRPERVLGMHFFSPANVMRLLEVVKTEQTSPETIAAVMGIGAKIGKLAVLVGNCDGFVGNRIVVQRKMQGQALLLEGAMPTPVDDVLFEFGFPMGPFAMSDLAGLDIGWNAEASKSETIRDVLCEMGRRGQKTQAGYYDYDDKRQSTRSVLVEDTIRQFWADHDLSPRDITDDEILQRCVYPMINEACKVLDEGIAQRASDIDAILVHGYGFPKYRGGICFYADQLGLGHVLEVMEKLCEQLGETMTPAALLRKLVAEEGKLSTFSNV